MAIRYESGSLDILAGRPIRALAWLHLAIGVLVVVLALRGETSWLLVAATPISLPVLASQVRFDERGVRWRPVRWSSWPTWRGWRERVLPWRELHDVEIDYAERRLVLVGDDEPIELTALSLPDLQPDRDLLAAFIERHRAAHQWQRERRTTERSRLTGARQPP